MEEFSPNPGVNACIADCLQHLSHADAEAIRRKPWASVRAQDEREASHTFREMIFGSFLAQAGRRVRAFVQHQGQEPDWSLFGDGGELAALLEVRSFHADRATEAEIRSELAAGRWASPIVDHANLSQRFYQAIRGKCRAYKDLARSLGVPYVIGCFLTFDNVVEQSIIIDNLHSPDCGLFTGDEEAGYPDVSGLAVMDEYTPFFPPESVANVYRIEYFPNPHAMRPLDWPAGAYCPPMSISRSEHYRRLVRFYRGEINQRQLETGIEESQAKDRGR